MLLFVSWRNKYAIIEWPLFDAPTSTHGIFTSFSIPQYCFLHFWKNKVGFMLAQGFLRVKGQAKIIKCYFLWVGGINMQSLSGHYLMRQKVPMVFFTSFSFSRYCCLRFCRNKFGLILAQGYFKGQSSSIIHKLQFFIYAWVKPGRDIVLMLLSMPGWNLAEILCLWCLVFSFVSCFSSSLRRFFALL